MSVSFMIIVSVGYIALLFLATMYNHFKGHDDLFKSSAFVLFVYAATHLGNTLWVANLPLKEQIATHYLYFAAPQALLAVGLFLINRHSMRVIMAITIGLLVVEVLLGYLVHVDRNVVALNGASIPNAAGNTGWFLWDSRNYISQFTTFTVLLSLVLPKIYQVKNEEDPDKEPVALAVNKAVKAYLEKFKEGSRIKARAKVYLDYSFEGLCSLPVDGSQEFHTEVGIELLNKAIRTCCYEPGRTKSVGLFGRFIYWLRS